MDAMKIVKIANMVLNIAILTALALVIYYYPSEKALYEECNIRILCELNKLDNPICKQYEDYRIAHMPEINVTLNIT